jgi:putative DNA modification/repair radical SAM protein
MATQTLETQEKIAILGESAQYDICASCGTSASRTRNPLGRWIYPAALPDGKTVRLLKILMTNACSNDCFYCATRCGRDFKRTSFSPDELARMFIDLHSRNLVTGLFLSSAVSSSARATMEKMIKAVEILRFRLGFKGYVHLKILPGAGLDYVERAVQLATRVSVNLEAPSSDRLHKISKGKNFDDLLLRMKWVKSLASGSERLTAGQTTQFVVGAADESDKEILRLTDRLYGDLELSRVYYSAFQPVMNTPLEDHLATPPIREHRLYQVDFLLRKYGFTFDEMVFQRDGNLSLDLDPKMVWALSHPERFPIEINKASREELLRVPGIGPKSASRIVKARLKGKLYSLQELRAMRVLVKRAVPFMLIDGRMLSEGGGDQLLLQRARDEIAAR